MYRLGMYSPSRKDYMTLSHPSSESAAIGAGYQLIGIVGYVGQSASSIQGQSNSGGMITVAEIKTIEKINNSTGNQESIAGTMQAAKIDDISKLIINGRWSKVLKRCTFLLQKARYLT
ncbi:MAG: hypothetical protein U5L72_01155 [Bacteroidales bacterium]|nr:hypothetical protein [Bacteroidales bacterium]